MPPSADPASLEAPDPPNNKHTDGAGMLQTPVIFIIYSHIGEIAKHGPLFPLYLSMYVLSVKNPDGLLWFSI